MYGGRIQSWKTKETMTKNTSWTSPGSTKHQSHRLVTA
ncbi:hypothetical protein T03_15970 [Trichinella britovi]|uniref:Uncharacterized protein n=1 Tax=Trichinella britovi TaxID=45882 RepID=A0A0V0YXB7_TRIBR|nr:hypothetical protein T03_15970 [Trichinella britovi]